MQKVQKAPQGEIQVYLMCYNGKSYIGKQKIVGIFIEKLLIHIFAGIVRIFINYYF
jgi:hypothetical protein